MGQMSKKEKNRRNSIKVNLKKRSGGNLWEIYSGTLLTPVRNWNMGEWVVGNLSTSHPRFFSDHYQVLTLQIKL